MTIVFAGLSLALVVSAVFAVASKHLVQSVLWLGVVLAVTAVLFVTLSAPLLGGIQILLYVGGVMTLMIFGVMLTGASEHEAGQPRPWAPLRAGLLACMLFVVLAAAILSSPEPQPAATAATASVGELLLTTNLLAFEALSFLLLAAMIGAIVLARTSDPGTELPKGSKNT